MLSTLREKLLTFWWEWVPTNARRLSDLTAACFIDGVYLVRWPWLGAVLPLFLFLVGFLIGWQHPGFSNSISYTYSLPIMALMLVVGSIASSQGAWLGLGYVLGDLILFERTTPNGLFPTVIRVYGPLILSYVLLAQLIVFIPLVSQSIRQATFPNIRLGDRKVSLVALPVAAALHALLLGGFTYLWVHTTPTLIRPLYTWRGRQPPADIIESLQQQGYLLVILAALLGVGRVLIEDYCQRTDTAHRADQLAAKVAAAEQNSIRLPHVVIAVIRSLFLTFMLSGILTGILQGGYLVLILFLIFTVRRYLSALFPLWPRITNKIPILVRLLLAAAINFWAASKFIQQYWGNSSNTFLPILLSTGVGFIVFSVFFPRPVSEEPGNQRITNTEQLLVLFASTALLTGFQQPVFADNCGSLSDCYMVIRNAIIAGGAIAIGVSLGLDLLPVIGDLKGILEAITGRDSVTGERLAGWQRILGAIPVIGRIPDLIRASGSLAKVASEAASVAKAAAASGDVVKTAEATQAAAKAANEAADIAKALDDAGDIVKASDKAKAVDAAQEAARAAGEASDAARSVGATKAADEAAAAADKARAPSRGTVSGSTQSSISKEANVRSVTANEVNQNLARKGYKDPPYTPGTKVKEFEYTQETVFYRLHGKNNQDRPWVMKKSEIEGLSKSEIRDKFSIPDSNSLDRVSEVRVPPGTRIREGEVNPLYGKKGRGIQNEIVLDRVPSDWFKEVKWNF